MVGRKNGLFLLQHLPGITEAEGNRAALCVRARLDAWLAASSPRALAPHPASERRWLLSLAAFKCRGSTLCCVDCSKDYSPAEARKHTTCISEAEKFEKTMYRGGGGKAKKVDPQELWTADIGKAAASATRHRELLERLAVYTNVPRKLAKFINFAKNSLAGVRDARGAWRAGVLLAGNGPAPMPRCTLL